MALILTDIELRVLGVLIEKSLTQAGSYPLSINAITSGANQRQNREPVTSYAEFDIADALRTLQYKKLAEQAPPIATSRVNRFQHCVVEELHWDRREQAVMAELMLRGRQTLGELRTRGSRMTPIPTLDGVSAILEALQTGDVAYVEALPREPGRSANRFRHLLSADEAAPTTSEPAIVEAVSVAPSDGADAGLAARVTALEEQVVRLTETVAALRGESDERIDDNAGDHAAAAPMD